MENKIGSSSTFQEFTDLTETQTGFYPCQGWSSILPSVPPCYPFMIWYILIAFPKYFSSLKSVFKWSSLFPHSKLLHSSWLLEGTQIVYQGLTCTSQPRPPVRGGLTLWALKSELGKCSDCLVHGFSYLLKMASMGTWWGQGGILKPRLPPLTLTCISSFFFFASSSSSEMAWISSNSSRQDSIFFFLSKCVLRCKTMQLFPFFLPFSYLLEEA